MSLKHRSGLIGVGISAKTCIISYNSIMGIFDFRRKRNASGGVTIQPITQPQVYSFDYDDYRANFAAVRSIVERASVAPYAIDSKGERLPDDRQPVALRRLYEPNNSMSFYDFIDYLLSSILTQPRVLVRISWNGSRRTSQNIAGYTFLPVTARKVATASGDVWQYTKRDGSIDNVPASDVMTFYYSQSTESFGRGISPAQAAKKWATISDYVADYQAGFFRNGARPDGMFIITANSYGQYKKAVDELERVHRRGAAGHFNYQYSYNPTDENGKPLAAASVEYKSYGSTNKDLALADILKNAQDKQDSAYGVPAIARGNDSTATYSNAQVSDRILAIKIEYLLRRVWQRFWHELNRCTVDTLDWAISFDYEVPALADSDKVRAETAATYANTLLKLVNAGVDVDSAAKALGLGDEWQSLKITPAERVQDVNSAKMDNEATDALKSASAAVESTTAQLKQVGASVSDKIAKANEVLDKLTNADGTDAEPETDPVDEKHAAAVRKLVKVISANDRKIIDKAAPDYADNDYEPTSDEVDEFNDQLAAILEPIAIEEQGHIIAAIIKDIGIKAPDHVPTAMDDPNWWKRLKKVAQGHDEFVAKQVEDALAKAEADGLDYNETKKLLSDIVDPERAKLMARNEIVNSERYGSLQATKALAEANGLKAYKVWQCVDDKRTCKYCRAMNGKTVPLDKSWAKVGDSIDADGDTLAIDWVDLDVPNAHANCRCDFVPKFEA